jgi:hypothetical protein
MGRRRRMHVVAGDATRLRRSGAAPHVTLLRLLVGVLVVGGSMAVGAPAVDAAYRLTFQNGTSVEVKGYEDVGEAIRYPRYGGTVTVPKGQVTAIEEVAGPFPPAAPSTAAAPPPTSRPALSGPTTQPGRLELPRVPANASPSAPPAAAPPAQTRAASGPSRGSRSFVFGGVSLLNILIPAVLLVATLLIGLRRIGRLGGGKGPLPYESNGPLLSRAERSFCGVLVQAVEGRYPIFAKVRLGDVLTVPPGTQQFWTHRNKIDRKHVDFVLCSPRDLTPVLAIELDDASHERADRRARDAFVDRALEAAGLPILHVPAQHAYVPAELRARIDASVNGDPTPTLLRWDNDVGVPLGRHHA